MRHLAGAGIADPAASVRVPRVPLVRLVSLVTLVATLLLGACGPVQYLSQVSNRAQAAVTAAKAAGAAKYAPYEYTMAVQYLHKAREKEGYADHQAAIRFGKKAEIFANKARRMALDHESEGDGDGPASDVDADAADGENDAPDRAAPAGVAPVGEARP
jgi:hypothetical protein